MTFIEKRVIDYIENKGSLWLNSDAVYLQGGLINEQLVTRFEKN